MNIVQFIAIRYLRSNRGNRFFSWISILTILGITISVAAMIVVLSVVNGFKSELRDRFLQANAHILAYRYPSGLENPAGWEETLMTAYKEDVTGISPFVHYETMARKGAIMHGVLTRGVHPEKREKVQSSRKLIHPPEAFDLLMDEIKEYEEKKNIPQTPSVILGAGLLKIFDAKIGDTIEIISPAEDTSKSIKSFRVVGVSDSGLKFYDNRIIIMSLTTAMAFYQMGSRVTGLEIGLKNPDKSPSFAENMIDRYALQIREWQSFNQPLFKAIQMERGVIFLVVSLTAVVASFNILTTLFVAVTQRQKDISILKSIGASNKIIVKIFLTQSLWMGFIGSTLGVLLALTISKILQSYSFIDLPEPYWINHLPVNYDIEVYFGVCILSLVGCFIASLFPALVASKVNPTDGFRGRI